MNRVRAQHQARSLSKYRMSSGNSNPERGERRSEGDSRVAALQVVNIVRGADGERHMFYHFGLLHVSVVICAACFGVIDLAGSTIEQAAELMYTHCSNAGRANRQLNTDHSYEYRPTKTAIREHLQRVIRSSSKPKSDTPLIKSSVVTLRSILRMLRCVHSFSGNTRNWPTSTELI